jgi:hypothetical protein
MASHLRLVKTLAHLQQEQQYSDEILLEPLGLTFTRGAVVEVSGAPSTGKTGLTLSLLSKLTMAGEICAVVDATGGFDPCTATLAGVEFENLLWVKCSGDIEKAFMSADYLVQAKGFGCIWLNLNGIPLDMLRMVPKTYWYRYRTRIKETPTVLLVTAREHVTGSASQQIFSFERRGVRWSGQGKFKLLREFDLKINARKDFYGESLYGEIGMDYREIAH